MSFKQIRKKVLIFNNFDFLQSEMPIDEVISMSPVSYCDIFDETMVLRTPVSVLVCPSRSAR